ncbi:hypothetical protein F5148DRAFT_905423 [Russula earlei]|uniref:Uncharacterized protein n=1 Tax=Russula earlei TaxID=71964 RepID=A0ACC0U9Q4_9AGAM|nr:hypothetical protein F5148DRAFT_905423 [Russula earlei]
MYATQARQSPLHACPSGEGVTKDTNSSSEILGEAQDAVSTTSPVESRFFPAPYPDIPVLHHPASYERPVDSQLSPDHIIYEGSPRNQEGDAPSAVEGIADASPFSDQLSLVESYYINDASPSVPSSKDSKITPPHATGTLQSPISFEPTAEVGEFDYEALYQSLVMSPEEAASKRMLWASRPSSSILPSRAGSAGSSSAACSSVLIDIPGSPHSAVSVPPWSHQRDMRTTPPPVSELTSRTSSPFLETPLSSGSSQADASAHASPVSLCASDAVAQSAPTSTPKYSRISAGTTSPHSEPVFAPSREVTSALNDRSKAEPARGKWNRVSTSRVVPFGFRHSLVIDGGHQHRSI